MVAESTSETDDQVLAWLEQNLGAVVSLRRQPRWRPMWFATVEGSSGQIDVVVRGDRTDMELIFPLDHEMRFQQVMQEQGLPVPAVHGWIDSPEAYVMDNIAGEPYLVNASEADRESVMDQYIDALAQLHACDIALFADRGIVRATDPAASGTVGLTRYEVRYRRAKRHPDPLLEFALGWLKRNPLPAHRREAPIVWDSGQFHHADGQLLAILDVELGHIGDPMMDLAAFRMRDTIGAFGDFNRLYERYEKQSGAAVEIEAVKWHHLAFTLTNRLAFSAQLRDPAPSSDLMTNLQWCRETDLFMTEAFGEILGLDLPEIELPATDEVSRADPAHEQLTNTLRSIQLDDEVQRYEVRKAFRLARHIRRTSEIGRAVDVADLDDLKDLLGDRPRSWHEGDAALEAFVLADEGAHDVQLIELLHRRNLRAHAQLGPAGSAMTTHHAIQRFT